MSQEVYKVSALEPGCWAIAEENVRCLLFAGTEKALLVDTGFGGGNLRELVAGLTDKPLTVINTHADRDHIGANQQFAEVWMHPSEYDRYRQNGSADAAIGPVAISAGPVVKPLWEQDILDIGGRTFEVILIPGHTPGSIALLDEQNGILISGDTVQNGNVFLFKSGRNIPAYIESLKKLQSMAYAGRFRQVYPSHGMIPLPASVISQLLEDIQLILVGQAQGEEREMYGAPIMAYQMKGAGFLCDR